MHHLLYHANCADGFAAACIARHALLTSGIAPAAINTQPVNYGWPDQMPLGKDQVLFAGDTVTYLDYTPPQEVIDTILQYWIGTVKLTIIDHHSTAAPRHQGSADTPVRFQSIFDLTHSGASLAWNHYFTDQCMPMAVQLIEHRDLGHAFQQPDAAPGPAALNLHAYLFRCLPRTFESWTPVIMASWGKIEPLCATGLRLRIADDRMITAAVNKCHWLNFSRSPHLPVSVSHPIPAVNGLDAGLISDACNALLKHWPESPFAAAWYIDAKSGLATYSLRSRPVTDPSHVNVAEIAAAMAPGGGGHPCAAGFSTPNPVPFA